MVEPILISWPLKPFLFVTLYNFYLQPIDEVLIELFNENITSEISLVKYYFCNHCNLYSQLVNLQFQDGHVYKMRKLKFFWSKPTLLKTAWGYLKIEKQLSWTNIIWLWSKPPPPTLIYKTNFRQISSVFVIFEGAQVLLVCVKTDAAHQ